MTDPFRQRALELQRRIADENIDLFLLTHPDSIYCLTAYWGDLGVEFGRPTVVAVPRSGEVTLITPTMESEMARAMTWVEDLRGYADGVGGEWTDPLRDLLAGYRNGNIAVERPHIPARVSDFLRGELGADALVDGSAILAALRLVKSPEEIEVIRQAGQVAVAMGAAGKAAIGEGVPEYEVSLACIAAGTRKAAEIIGSEDSESFMSPMIHNLQVLQSGHFTSMTHRHPTVRRIRRGDPIYMCFCPIAHFKQFKLGYDREYFTGEVADDVARTYETAVAAQQAAIATMRPGVTAEEVHFAALEVYAEAGYGASYRTGRAIGYSSLEQPELKAGDKTPLRAGMAFAVDGGITIPGVFGARVGDTVLVTESDHEVVTEYPRDLEVL